jgi:hypothetical protein
MVTITKIACLAPFKEIIAAYSENNSEPINTICGQNAEFLNVKEAVHIFITPP